MGVSLQSAGEKHAPETFDQATSSTCSFQPAAQVKELASEVAGKQAELSALQQRLSNDSTSAGTRAVGVAPSAAAAGDLAAALATQQAALAAVERQLAERQVRGGGWCSLGCRGRRV